MTQQFKAIRDLEPGDRILFDMEPGEFLGWHTPEYDLLAKTMLGDMLVDKVAYIRFDEPNPGEEDAGEDGHLFYGNPQHLSMPLDATCPFCDGPGCNRIWECGTIMVKGAVHQGHGCDEACGTTQSDSIASTP